MAFTLDVILEKYAAYGHYQKRILLISCLAVIVSSPQVSLLVFIAGTGKWHCADKGDTLLSEKERCDLFSAGQCVPVFDNQAGSINAEFGLVCDHATDGSIAQSLYFVGMLLGSLCAGWYSDAYGRQRGSIAGVVIMSFGSLWSYLAHSFWSFAFSRLIIGLGSMWAGVVLMVLVSECVEKEARAYTTSVVSCAMSLGMASTSLIAYYFRHSWRTAMLALTLDGALSAVVIWLFGQESPRWLLTNGRYAALKSQLNLWSGSNGKHIPAAAMEAIESWGHDEDTEELMSSDHRGDTITLMSLWSGRFRHVIFSLLFCWVVVCFISYGVVLNVENVGSSRYISFFAIALVPVPFNYASITILEKIGRVPGIFWSFVMSGLFTALCAVSTFSVEASKGETGRSSGTSASQWLLVFSVLAKAAATVAFSAVYTYTPELLPTAIRTRGLGISALVSRFGGVAAPLVIAWGHHHQTVPYIMYSICAGLAAFAMYRMPETTGKKSPQTMKDVDNLLAGC